MRDVRAICVVSMPVRSPYTGRPRVQRHHDFLERRVAGALADAVDRDLHLPRPGLHARQRVGRRHAEIVVAVHRPRRPRRRRGVSAMSSPMSAAVLRGRGVAHRVGDVQRRRPRLDGRRRAPRGGSRGRSGRRPRGRTRRPRRATARRPTISRTRATHLVARHLQLVLEMDVAGGEKGVDPRMSRVSDGLPALVDVDPAGAREARDDRHARLGFGGCPTSRAIRLHGLEIVGRGGGEARPR